MWTSTTSPNCWTPQDKTLVSLMHGNNEIANLLPIKQVGELCAWHDALFPPDTVQTMGHYTFDLQDLNVAFITGAGHKFHGPKGVGFLYVDKALEINARITGGGQERQLRGGTENLYGIVGIGAALELCTYDMRTKAMSAALMVTWLASWNRACQA